MLEDLTINSTLFIESTKIANYFQNDLHIREGYEPLVGLGLIIGVLGLAAGGRKLYYFLTKKD